ncbi:hypothetical protein CGC20_39260 [Leishmania donovani]|uniref:Uncharacterized protein n=1 Tax=Leishmania donovani TaxID=5661 RepID=A0A504Y3Q8_LEIDO|nr:hypothetical protein CGC20_39260 [Leishmania donovani]
MRAPIVQLEDYRLMEPSPSPPAVARIPLPGSHVSDSQASHGIRSDDLLWSSSAARSSPSLSEPRNSTKRTQSRGETFDLVDTEADIPSLSQPRVPRSVSHSQGSSQRRPRGAINVERSGSACATAGAVEPLATRSVNALPTSSRSNRRPGLLAAVPAPLFTWEEGDNEGRASDVTAEEEDEKQCLTQPGAPRPLPYDQQKQAMHALACDLAALVNAGTVDRCRSDSRGQVDLIGNDVADQVTKNTVDACDRVESARSAGHSNDAGDDVNASYEFEQEYFYCPTTPPETVGPGESGERAASVLRGAETPRRAVSDSSSSSSTPRWVLSLAEETPFTPFVLSATGVATAPTPFLHVSPAIRATATAVAVATEEQLRQGHLGTSTGAQQQMRMPTQRLSVHKLVAAILSSTCTGTASGTAAPVLAAAPIPMASAADEAEDVSERRPEEPLPRRPPGCDEGMLVERERLRQRVRDTQARLTHVDQLMARFDVVVAARQAELEKLREKQAVMAQQADSYKSRAATATREVRRLRERQHGQDEVRLLCNMMADKKNRLHVAQSQLSRLQNLWKQLQLLHTATAGTTEGDAEEGADHVRSARADGATDGGSAEDPREKERTPSSPASSVASLDTCNDISDFLEELLGEVEDLAKVCIQLPSAPPAAALSSCNSMRRLTIKHPSGAADQGLQRAQPSQSRPTYTTLNRRLNNGNNGFFSFFGGATEAHLDSKPLSTFLANLDRLARTSWEREEELQLRARELATEEEEDSLKARLALEYGVKLQQPQLPQHLSGSSGSAGEKMGALSPLSPVALSSEREEEHLSNGRANGTPALTSPIGRLTPPNDAVAASTDRATRQISLSSPEHGRRSRGSSVGPRTPNGIVPLPSSAASSLSHHRVTPAPFLLPTLVYAYPRVAAVSQHLDAEQQQIQADYAAAIEAERQGRRQLTMQLNDTYRQHVAPVLRRAIDALRRHQASLARQLAELGVKAVTIQWEEEEPEEFNDAALLRAIDSATAAGQKPLWGIQWRRATSGRSRSRASAKVSTREKEEDSYGDAPDSQCTSLARSEYGGLRNHHASTPQQHEAKHGSRLPKRVVGTPAEPNITTPLAESLTGTSSKACAALQLCTHSPTKALHPGRRNAHTAAGETEGCARAAAVSTAIAHAGVTNCRHTHRHVIVPAKWRHTPCLWRNRRIGDDASFHCSWKWAEQQRLRQRSDAAITASELRVCRLTNLLGNESAAPLQRRPQASCCHPVVEDVRELAAAADSAFSASTRVNMSTLMTANVWSPFQRTGQALADGAVRVALTFTGEEARRRQAAQARQEAHQRKFWELREELARIEEDTFQLRTRWTELQSTRQSIETEHRTKLAEAEAKMKKFRTFYESLRRENKEWQSIRDELERVIRGE